MPSSRVLSPQNVVLWLFAALLGGIGLAAVYLSSGGAP